MYPLGHASAHFLQPLQTSSLILQCSPFGSLTKQLLLQYIQQVSQSMHMPQDMQRLASSSTSASVKPSSTSVLNSRSAAETRCSFVSRRRGIPVKLQFFDRDGRQRGRLFQRASLKTSVDRLGCQPALGNGNSGDAQSRAVAAGEESVNRGPAPVVSLDPSVAVG